ncbi:MAG: membrane protein insertion efficiency factor YidD [Hahellaceae bacterium]|nr:membrane protein insertion efficiency factor YidD [Hahellaceae bacterium]
MLEKCLMIILVGFIRGYQLTLSPFIGMHCRFHPTCSTYAIESIKRHGSLKGCYFAVRRLLRCHPWSPGGCDPVPGHSGRNHDHSQLKP